MSKIFPYIIGIALILGVGMLGYSIYKNTKNNAKEE